MKGGELGTAGALESTDGWPWLKVERGRRAQRRVCPGSQSSREEPTEDELGKRPLGFSQKALTVHLVRGFCWSGEDKARSLMCAREVLPQGWLVS